MSLRNTLASRFKAQLGSKAVTAVAGALLTVGLARLLEPTGYGLLSLTLAVASMFQLVARFGIGRSAGRYVAEYKENDPGQIPHIVRTAILFVSGSITVAVLVLTIGHGYIAAALGEPELVSLLLLSVLFIVFGTSVAFLEHVLQGFEHIRFVAGLKALERISRPILALGLVAAGFGAVGALWGYVLSSLIASIVGFVYLYRRVQSFYDGTAAVEQGLRRRIAEYAVPIMATNTSMILDKRIDTLLVGFFLTPVAVSYYAIAGQVVSFVITPLAALSFTISPTFGSEKAAGNVERISRIYEETLVNALLLYIPAGAGIILLADPLITLLFGSDYAGSVPVLQILGVYVIVTTVQQISDNGLDYLGRARERAIARFITALLNVGLNIALIPTIGVVGAAIATVVTRSMYTAANLFIISQEFDLRVAFILRKLSVITGITVAMSIVVFAFTGFISGWITLGLVISLGVAVWGVLSVTSGLLEVRKIVSMLR